ncbi:MAG: DUF6017 domain-containing protein [bacterium]
MLFSQEQFKNISPEAKVLYGILLKRMDLSAKNGWFDDQGRVYIICTLEEIMETLNCGNQKAVKLMDELEGKIGLIERKRQGLGKPNLIYVKNFICPVDKVDNSAPSHFLKCENHTSGDVKITLQEVRKSHGSNTDNNDTDNRYTENRIYPGRDADGMAERRSYENYFREAIEFDFLLQQYPYDRETLHEILDLLVDTVCTRREYIRFASDDKPRDVVKSRFMKLDSGHIQYVMECLKENTTDVRNIKQYLLAALYNAPGTISSYYSAKVKHDMYGSP